MLSRIFISAPASEHPTSIRFPGGLHVAYGRAEDRAMTPASSSYSHTQQILHWLVVGLLICQFLTAEAMEHFLDKAEDAGKLAGFPTDLVPMSHAIFGGTIFLLMLLRVWLRLTRGAPAAPGHLPTVLKLASRATHFAIYALLLLLPLTGAVALYVTASAGDVHVVLKTVLLAFIAAHVAGALVHGLVLKDGVIRRMLPNLS